MPTLIITVDPQCCRCITKLQNILCSIQDRGEFVIDKISYEKDKVLVSGPFVAEKLYCKLWCKAGKIIKGIEVDKPKPKPEPDKPKPKPEPPKCTLVPWPYPYPYPQHPPSTCPPCDCGCPTPHCECHSKPPSPPPPTPPPAPTPPKPPTCVCPTWPSCHCCSYPPTPMPYPTLLVCEENPPYGACTVM